MNRWSKQQPLKRLNFFFDRRPILGWEWGACVAKSLCPELPTTPLTRSHPVEAECVVDDRVFAGINEPRFPEPRKEKDGW